MESAAAIRRDIFIPPNIEISDFDLSDSFISEIRNTILSMKESGVKSSGLQVYSADAIKGGDNFRTPVLHLHKVAFRLAHGGEANKVIPTTIAVQRLASTPIKDPFHEKCIYFIYVANIINAIAIYLLPTSVYLSFLPYSIAPMLIVPILSIAYVTFHPNKDKVTEEVHKLAVQNLANYLYPLCILECNNKKDRFVYEAVCIGRLSQPTAEKLFARLHTPFSASRPRSLLK